MAAGGDAGLLIGVPLGFCGPCGGPGNPIPLGDKGPSWTYLLPEQEAYVQSGGLSIWNPAGQKDFGVVEFEIPEQVQVQDEGQTVGRWLLCPRDSPSSPATSLGCGRQ